MKALFSARQLHIRRRGRVILDVPELYIPQGIHSAIIGPNGAGKSTLLRALLGLGGGEVQFDGLPVADSLRRGRIAWVGQHGHYNLPLSVRDYVLLGRHSSSAWLPRPDARHPEADALLEIFDLSHLCGQRIASLSGGEQQRANLVRALLQNAPALLLDEPCNHLDIRHQHRLMAYLQQQQARFSTVMVLHDLNLAARYAGHIILMQQGRIVASGSVDAVMNEALLQQVYQWPIRRCDEGDGVYFRSDAV